MLNIFVSYSRHSQPAAKNLVDDIELLGHSVWFDRDLSGGQSWWDQILAQIRLCDVFVFVLDQRALNSVACQRELSYAVCVNKSVLPVLIDSEVSTGLLPSALSTIQYVDYTKQERTAALALGRALTGMSQTQPLPDPLPSPPETPVSYLRTVAQRFESSAFLAFGEQSALIIDLGRAMRDPELAADARRLIQKLRRREDLFAAIADEIDKLLRIPATQMERPAPKLNGRAVRAAVEPWPPTVLERLWAAIIGCAVGALVGAGSWGAFISSKLSSHHWGSWQLAAIQLALVGTIVGFLTGKHIRSIRVVLAGCIFGAALGVGMNTFFSDGLDERTYGVFWNILGGGVTALITRMKARAIGGAFAGYVIGFMLGVGGAEPYPRIALEASVGSVVAAIIGAQFYRL